MTPLYDAIRAFSAQHPVRLHIPGHKGKPLPIPELAGAAALDVTELGPTGDLFHGGAPGNQHGLYYISELLRIVV